MFDTLKIINETAAFNRWAGFEVVRADQGEAELRMPWRNEMGQYSGYLHAGMVAALLDTVCGFAAATVTGRVLASHFSVNCLAPAVGQVFVASGKVVKAGRKQVFASGELYAESDGVRKLVATGSAILVPVDAS
jgi:uncharacterized protein (TIGR00369 family)